MIYSTIILHTYLFLVIIRSSSAAAIKDLKEITAEDKYYQALAADEQTFTAIEHKKEGYEEVILGYNSTFSLQRTATDGDSVLRLQEITNGSLVVQLIFSPLEELVDCDYSNSNQQIHRLSKHISQKHHKTDTYLPISLPIEVIKGLLDMESWISKCNKLHSNNLSQSKSATESTKDKKQKSAEDESQIIVTKDTITLNQDGNNQSKKDQQILRPKRGFTDLIYPGTKWCGAGNSAKEYDDLGPNKHTDMCCRQHDMCKDTILPLSSNFNYFNYGLITLSSCDCDRQFKLCLEKASRKRRDTIADLIGHLYFNVIGMKCFILEEADFCIESSWWGRCLKTEKRMSAAFNEILTY